MFFKAVFLLAGTVIGAGMFALPYSFLLSGFWPGVFGLAGLGALTLALNLFYVKVILATTGDHQLSGYAKIYLGSFWRWVSSLALAFSVSGALLAYVVLGGEFLALLFGAGPPLYYRLLFFCLGALIVLRGFRSLSGINGVLTVALILLSVSLPLFGRRFFYLDNLNLPTRSVLAFYGPVLFSLSGVAVIPEIEEALRGNRRLLPLAVIAGTLIPVIIYFVFGFGILAISGEMTTVDALSGLAFWSPALVRVGAAVGLLSCLTSFISLSDVAKELLYRDFSWPENLSLFASLTLPFLAIFLTINWFLKIISLTGSLAVGAVGIFVCVLFYRLEKSFWKKLLAALAGVMLVLGMLTVFFAAAY